MLRDLELSPGVYFSHIYPSQESFKEKFKNTCKTYKIHKDEYENLVQSRKNEKIFRLITAACINWHHWHNEGESQAEKMFRNSAEVEARMDLLLNNANLLDAVDYAAQEHITMSFLNVAMIEFQDWLNRDDYNLENRI